MTKDLVESGSDYGVSALGGVLVAVRRGGGGVPEAGHQLADTGALLGRKGAGRMAKVVEMDPGQAECLQCPVPSGVQRRPAQPVGEWPGEDWGARLGADVAVQVLRQRGADGGRDVHGAPAGVGRRGCRHPFAVFQLDGLAVDADLMANEVDVPAFEAEQLAEPQAAEAGEQHESAVPLLDGRSDAQDDLGVDERSLR